MKRIISAFICVLVFILSSCDYPAVPINETGENQNGEIKTEEANAALREPLAEQQNEKKEPEEKLNTAEQKPKTAEQKPAANQEKSVAAAKALDRTKHGFGYSPNSEHKQVSIGKKYEDMMTAYGAFFIDRANTANIYLTMDEGYENGYTPAILDTLREKGVPCTFFVTKPYLDKNPTLVKRMIDEGHTVGNHSVNHKSMPTLTDEEAKKEITVLHDEVLAKFGYSMKYFRPPMGEYSQASLYTAQSLGYRSVFWSFAYRDWEMNNQKGKDYAVESVEKGIHNGCILLLHAVSKDNAEGLGEIIDRLRAKGYVFSSLDRIVCRKE